MAQKTITAILVDETRTYSYLEVCEKFDMSETMLIEMIEHGLLNASALKLKDIIFDQKMIGRIQAARRLQQDLEVNLPGVVLALELLDELALMREELSILRRHFESSL